MPDPADLIYCSRLGCVASIRRELLPGRWEMLAGLWFCPEDVADCRRRFMPDVLLCGEDTLDMDERDP